MIGILGSGFGLYGYLPASVSLEMGSVLLPSRYQKVFSIREELQPFLKKIEWLDSDLDLIKTATTLIISRRPGDQSQLIDTVLAQPNIKNIIFEKPFSINPGMAKIMQDKILNSQKICSVSYIFRYFPWAITLKDHLVRNPEFEQESLKLTWRFMAHHYNNNLLNWKRDHEQGGGVLRFYGIHIIALLAEWGYNQVEKSNFFLNSDGVSYSRWSALFKGINLPNFEIDIDIKSVETLFNVKRFLQAEYIYQGSDPFDEQGSKNENISTDLRCNYLRTLLLENNSQIEVWPHRYVQAINLWDKVENDINQKKLIAVN